MKVCGVEFDRSHDPDELLKKIEEYKNKDEIFIQIFNHKKVIGEDHLLWAYQKATECMDQNSNRADSLDIETLLWASAEWQIKEAIDKMGVPEKSKKAVIMVEKDLDRFLTEMGWERNDELLEPTIDKLKRFGIGQEEIESVTEPYDLIFEKMSTSIL